MKQLSNQLLLEKLQLLQKNKALRVEKRKQKQEPHLLHNLMQQINQSSSDEVGKKLFEDSDSDQNESLSDKQKQSEHKDKTKFESSLSNLRSILHKGSEQKPAKKKVTFKIEQKQSEKKEYVIHNMDRKWKQKPENYKKGRFDPLEKRILWKSLTQCIEQKGISLEQVQASIREEQSEKIPRNLHFWTKICSVLPNRTLVSCYKYLKRELATKYGSWTEQETELLKRLQDQHGNKWKQISKQMKRTPECIRDKFRSLGEQNHEQIEKQVWKIETVVKFLQLLQKSTDVEFLDPEIQSQLDQAQNHNKVEIDQAKRRKRTSKTFMFHINFIAVKYINKKFMEIKLEDVRWKKISDKLGNKTVFDCRNKFVQLLQFMCNKYSHNRNRDEEILNFVIKKGYSNESKIDWQAGEEEWGDMSALEAKNRWLILKKHIQGRGQKEFKEILEIMKQKYLNNSQND